MRLFLLIFTAVLFLPQDKSRAQIPDTLDNLEILIPGKYLKTVVNSNNKTKVFFLDEEKFMQLDSLRLNTDTLAIRSYRCDIRKKLQIKRESDLIDKELKSSIKKHSHNFFFYQVTAVSRTGRTYAARNEVLVKTSRPVFGISGGLVYVNSDILNHYLAYQKQKGILNYNVSGTMENGRSFFATGPLLSPHFVRQYTGKDSINFSQYRLNGFHLLYQFNLHPRAKKFNSFFQFQFLYTHYKNSGVTLQWIPYGGPINPRNIRYTSQDNVRRYYIGYGLKIKCSERFYISPDASVGIVIEREYIYFDKPYTSFNTQYGDTWLGVKGGLTLGYKFGN